MWVVFKNVCGDYIMKNGYKLCGYDPDTGELEEISITRELISILQDSLLIGVTKVVC